MTKKDATKLCEAITRALDDAAASSSASQFDNITRALEAMLDATRERSNGRRARLSGDINGALTHEQMGEFFMERAQLALQGRRM